MPPYPRRWSPAHAHHLLRHGLLQTEIQSTRRLVQFVLAHGSATAKDFIAPTVAPRATCQADIAFLTFPRVDVFWALPNPVTWVGGTQPPGCNTITGPAPHPADMFPQSAMTPECWLAAYGQFHTVCATKQRTAPTLEFYQMSTPACLLYTPQFNTTHRVNVDAARTRC